MGATDEIPVTCSRCKARFQEKIARLRDGNQLQCPNGSCFITYSNETMDPAVRRALTEARRIRSGFVYETIQET